MTSSASVQTANRLLTILAFHKIGRPPNGEYPTWNYIPEATFLRQLAFLRDNAWHVIDLPTFLRALSEPQILPRRAALLTFDDGYRSLLTVALPLLRRFGFPAVCFVPTQFIGCTNAFDDGIEPEEAICSWMQLRELESHRVSIQSHGATHRPFSDLDFDQQREELVQSKADLEAGLDKSVEVLAYPYGDDGADPIATGQVLKQTGYQAACLYGGGWVEFPVVDRYRLPRVAMGPDTDLRTCLAR